MSPKENDQWNYVGPVPSSKSLYIRALLLKSYYPQLQISAESDADDVLTMKMAVNSLFNKLDIDCGRAGAVLRFMAVRAAREKGTHVLKGSERLLQRRPQDLTKLIMQLGCDIEFETTKITLRSYGFKLMGDGIHVPVSHTSQLASSLLLNAWELPQSVNMTFETKMASEGYWEMSKLFAKQMGMNVEDSERGVIVRANQKLKETRYFVEPDMSCAFAVAALAAIGGRCDISLFPELSIQPDVKFTRILSEMGARVSIANRRLQVQPGNELLGTDVNLRSTPDLFPVLATLCAFAKGHSRLFGAHHLADKESNRLEETAKLLKLLGAKFEVHDDGMTIEGGTRVHTNKISYDPAEDHRMVMAAVLAKKYGFQIDILNPETVNKSFPGFLQVAGVLQ